MFGFLLWSRLEVKMHFTFNPSGEMKTIFYMQLAGPAVVSGILLLQALIWKIHALHSVIRRDFIYSTCVGVGDLQWQTEQVDVCVGLRGRGLRASTYPRVTAWTRAVVTHTVLPLLPLLLAVSTPNTSNLSADTIDNQQPL